MAERIATLQRAEQALRAYLGSLGVGEDSPAPPVAEPHRRSPELGVPPAVTRLARHVEVKVAVAMREQGLRDETVVIDRQICGTRPFDQAQPFTCDKYLARLLPPGGAVARGAGGRHGSYLHREGRGIE